MSVWAVIIPAERWATERLFHHETVTLAGGAGAVALDDEVLLVAGGGVVALAQAVTTEGDDLVLAYVRRAYDEPVPADELLPAGAPGGLSVSDELTAAADLSRAGDFSAAEIVPVDSQAFRRVAAALGAARRDKKSWLVSVALPIEAASPAEAVRQFWSHVHELGPVELPTYVWPSGDELAMQAFVLGAEANQDPEEEDED